MHLSVEEAAQKVVGEVSGVVQLVRQHKLTSTWLLQTCASLLLATVVCISTPYAVPQFVCNREYPTVTLNMRASMDILLTF